MVKLSLVNSGFPTTLSDSWVLKILLKGIDRDKGQAFNRKLPTARKILRKIFSVIHSNDSRQLAFWMTMTCLEAFYRMLRKSFFPSDSSFRMTLQNCKLHSRSISIKARYSKTNVPVSGKESVN